MDGAGGWREAPVDVWSGGVMELDSCSKSELDGVHLLKDSLMMITK